MTTSPKQISLFGEDELTSLPEGSPANPFHLQEKDLERQITATSGRNIIEQSKRFNRLGSSGKMFLACLIGQEGWYSSKCRLIWKMKGTKSGRLYFQLAASAHPTGETEFGLWHIIKISNGGEIIVDAEDYAYLNQWKWKIHNGYAARSTRTESGLRNLLMHRVITNAQQGEEVDHINRNKLDNRKQNLRIVSHWENSHNRQKGTGVHKPKGRNKWYAQIYVNNVRTHLGCFDTKEDAINARIIAEKQAGLLPTPTCQDVTTRTNKSLSPNAAIRPNIALMAKNALLPTPQAIDGNGQGRYLRLKKDCNRDPSQPGSWRGDLKDFAIMGMLPTPTANDSKNATMPESQNDRDGLTGVFHPLKTGKTSQLNPLFVNEMMGFPLGWLNI